MIMSLLFIAEFFFFGTFGLVHWDFFNPAPAILRESRNIHQIKVLVNFFFHVDDLINV